MENPNPLMRRRLTPLSDQTSQDFENRLRALQNPGSLLASRPRFQKRPLALPSRKTRTSAAVNLAIAAEDQLPEDYLEGKDTVENVLFSSLNQDPEEVHTYVESLATGKFSKMLNNEIVMDETLASYKPVSDNEKEVVVYKKLEEWSYRLHRFFLLLQGFLAGISLLHIYLIYFNDDNEQFIQVYGQIARMVGTLFFIFTFFAFVGILHRLVNEYKHYRKILESVVDYDIEQHRAPYYIAWFCALCYGFSYLVTVYNADFVSEMHYKDVENSDWASTEGISSSFETKLQIWSVLSVLRSILCIVAWVVICIKSKWNIGTLFRMKLDSIEEREEMNLFSYLEGFYKHLFYGNPYLSEGVYFLDQKKDN